MTPLKPSQPRWQTWLNQQQLALQLAWHYLKQLRWRAVMMSVCIAVALLFPILGLRGLQLAHATLNEWHQREQVAVFFYPTITPHAQRTTALRISTHPLVQNLHWLTPEHGLQTLKQYFSKPMLETLSHHNPLPMTLVITLKPHAPMPQVKQLLHQLHQLPSIANVSANLRWLQQLQHLLTLWHHVVHVLTGVIVALVVLLLSNTSRLLVWLHRADAQLLAHLGTPTALLNRPYQGACLLIGLLSYALAFILGLAVCFHLAPQFEDFLQAFFPTHPTIPPWSWGHLGMAALGLLILVAYTSRTPKDPTA